MECINPLRAGFDRAGNIVYSTKKHDRSIEAFAFPCRKCLPCRLNIAREKAIRCWHQAKIQENSIFLTLTYDDQNLPSQKLQYSDFQEFMKRLRAKVEDPIRKIVTDPDLLKEQLEKVKISYMVTGEYGEKHKRPHWHAIVFNYYPPDPDCVGTTELGHKVYTSKILSELWGKGRIEIGDVTIESAGYVARYATKKLAHGKDQDHDFQPIHKTSSRRAIGRAWIEKYYKHTFENGFIVMPDGTQGKIPRYYVDWCKQHQPKMYEKYITEVREELIEKVKRKQRREELEYLSNMINAGSLGFMVKKKRDVKHTILKQKFKRLRENLKL